MQTQELLKKVRKIEIKTRKLSENIFGGEYHSAFKGRGMTFSEVRPYQFGDDVRNIDWNVTARYNDTFVKVFEEERELTLMLMVDVSQSESFGTQHLSKKDMQIEIAATLAFSALKNNDKTGLILFSDKIELFIPPKKGKSHILRIIRELIEFSPQSKKTSIASALEFLNRVLKRRAIVFLLSDFLDNNYQKELLIASKKHDLNALRVYDDKEQEIPNLGIICVEDAETGKTHMVDTSSKAVRENFKNQYSEHVSYFEKNFKKVGSGIIQCRTDEDYIQKLLSYFKRI